MLKGTSILIFHLFSACFLLFHDVYGQIEIVFENGGKHFEKKEYSDTKDFYRRLVYGETLAYWHEQDLGYSYGPSLSNQVRTILSDSMETNVEYLASETRLATKGVSTGIQSSKLETFTSFDSLLMALENVSMTLQVSWEKLRLLYGKAMLSHDFSDLDLLNYLLENNMITTVEYDRLREALESDSLFVNLNAYSFLHFIMKYGLSGEIDILAFQHALRTQVLQAALSQDSLQVERHIGILDQTVDLQAFERQVRIGSPRLKLTKRVVQPYILALSGTVNYSITIANIGKTTAIDIILLDCLPKGLKFLQSRIRGNLCKVRVKRIGDKEIVIWSLKNAMPPQESCTIYFDTDIQL